MNIEKYINNLPEEILEVGKFCVTLYGDKSPFDPIKNYRISSKDPMYHIHDLISSDVDFDKYETLSIQLGGDFVAIDLDKVINDGVPSELALEIIDYFKTYTEISPSKKGFRLLFKSTVPFDRNVYKIKNPKLDIEYYDGKDQETNGGRIVRLSGERYNDYPFKVVDPTEFLNKYMKRDITVRKSMVDDQFNEDKCKSILWYINRDRDLKSIMNRDSSLTLSESDYDYIIANTIAYYTDSNLEVAWIFENTKWFKTKRNIPPKYHLNKYWKNGYKQRLLDSLAPRDCNHNFLCAVNSFDTCSPNKLNTLDKVKLKQLLTFVGLLTGASEEFTLSPQETVDYLNHINVLGLISLVLMLKE